MRTSSLIDLKRLKANRTSLIRWGSLSVALLTFILLVFFLRMAALRKQHRLETLLRQVENQKALIAHTQSLNVNELRTRLTRSQYLASSADHLSEVLAELNDLGTAQGIEIIATTPLTGQTGKASGIQLELKGTYQGLGEFLGELDGLKSAPMVVDNMSLAEKPGEGGLGMGLTLQLLSEDASAESGNA